MRLTRGLIATVSALACLAAGQPASRAGRPVASWNEEMLWKQSDVVAIATADSSESPDLLNAKPDTWTPVKTRFRVLAVLKGRDSQKQILLLHYRFQDPKRLTQIIDGPGFVRFDPKKRSTYLLFLKFPKKDQQTGDGALEPVTGQMDPDRSFSKMVQIDR